MQIGKDYKMLIFLDTETTGLESDDKICSIAVVCQVGDENVMISDLVNEGKKIPPKASSVHHITNEMIRDKGDLKSCDAYRFLEEYNNEQTTIVGHNVKFDLEKLALTGFRFRGNVIDTLRVAKHLIPECEFFSLQILRYELKLYRLETVEIRAHDALSDALVVKSLYEYFLEMATIEEMQELSFKNALIQKLQFGKYVGRHIEEIAMIDRGYLEWMLSQVVDLDEDLRYSVVYYLGENG